MDHTDANDRVYKTYFDNPMSSSLFQSIAVEVDKRIERGVVTCFRFQPQSIPSQECTVKDGGQNSSPFRTYYARVDDVIFSNGLITEADYQKHFWYNVIPENEKTYVDSRKTNRRLEFIKTMYDPNNVFTSLDEQCV
jgi:hypothetical protein